MLEKLKEDVFKANLQLVKYGLVVLTWETFRVLTVKKDCL